MKQQTLHALLRTNLACFIEKSFLTMDRSQTYTRNWHIEVIADHLTQCMQGKIKRLIINLPPRSLKSVCASVAFPAWLLGHEPHRRIVCVSYSEDLANKHARDCRSVIESDWYKATFANTRINPRKRTENEFETTRNGYRISTSTGGTLTGRGGNIIIIDDPLKPADGLSDTKRNNVNQWFDNTLYSRLDNKETGCIIIVMQRIHLDDLVGYVQRNEEWTVLNLPAIAMEPQSFRISDGTRFIRAKGDALNPTLESEATLEKIKANLGSYNFSAQYQQEPIPESGNIINWDWFDHYSDIPETQSRKRIIQSWDTAMKAHDGSDYSACITIQQVDNAFYVLDAYRAKLDFPSLKKEVIRKRALFNADDIIIEDKNSGTSLIQQLRSESIFCIEYKPEGTKADRMCYEQRKQ